MSKVHVYFCSFASENLKKSLLRIKKQAENFDVFNKIFVYSEKSLSIRKKKEINKIMKTTGTRRGYGYWSWKPYVILKTLNKIEDNDILIYCDAGCHLNANEKSKAKLYEYISEAQKNDIFVTQLVPPYTDKNWTKKDLLVRFENKISQELLEQGQIQATTIILKKSSFSVSVISEWNEYMSLKNIHLFDDSQSLLPNEPNFVENRHDQSVFSLILKSRHYASRSVDNFHASDEYGWRKLEDDEPILQKRDKEFSEKRKSKWLKYIISRIAKFVKIFVWWKK